MPYRFQNIDVYNLGERGSGFKQGTGEIQDFYKLRDELVAKKELFEDPDFKAVSSSLYYSQDSTETFQWLRPKEISNDPKFIVEGASRFDIMQGDLGDCWFLAAVANLTLNEQLFKQVVPHDQGFKDKYAGMFHFRFWQYGRWVDVVIDDRLPTIGRKLVFMDSSQPNEFWSALLEKAYAKLHGSYEALSGGRICEAMEDFTGGLGEKFELRKAPENLFQIMLKAYERMSLMAGAIEADIGTTEALTAEGLVNGHAYSITKVKYADIATPNKKGKIALVRLRNPWGDETEWKGAWSDKSPEWNFIPAEEKLTMGLTVDQDGEFWMSFYDFVKRFDKLEICLINPDTLSRDFKGAYDKRWEMSVFEGEWVRGVSAGGCRNYPDAETFHCNPQYRITLNEIDEGDEDKKCTVIIALMQKNRRALRKEGAENLTIGFAVFRLYNPDTLPKPLNMEFFRTNTPVAICPSFVTYREVTCRFKLPLGVYCIVPSTIEPKQEGEFILRIFSEKKNHMEENDQKVEICEIDNRVKQQTPDDDEEKREKKLKEFYGKITGENPEIHWVELKQILDQVMKNETHFQGGFSKDVCRSMIAMMDIDRSGKLGFEEFKKLWIDIRSWQQVFKLYDKGNTGFLNPFELREALASAGYHLNTHILNVIGHRYTGKDGEMAFDDFMMCVIRLKSMMEIFQERAAGKDIASFKLEEWIETTLYS